MSNIMTMDEDPVFIDKANAAKFAIETKRGFWNHETQSFHRAVENGSHFTWLEQNDALVGAMENIAGTKDAWFRIITVEPFKD